MKTIDKHIKRLAEKYYYGNRKLTAKERTILENSKYKNLLGPDREYHEFDKILENFAETSNVDVSQVADQPVVKNQKYYMFQSRLGEIKDLIDEIEDAFFLDLGNFGLDRYKNIDVNQLKAFVANYANTKISNGTLKEEIKRALSGDSVWAILYKLRMLLTR
jgi:hypothetical protein